MQRAGMVFAAHSIVAATRDLPLEIAQAIGDRRRLLAKDDGERPCRLAHNPAGLVRARPLLLTPPARTGGGGITALGLDALDQLVERIFERMARAELQAADALEQLQ